MRKRAIKNEANMLLEIHMQELGWPFTPEYVFHPTRKWRFDYLVMPLNGWAPFAVEIEGAIWTRGRHTRGAGYLADLEKYREAARMGFRVYRFSTQEVLDGTARQFLSEL